MNLIPALQTKPRKAAGPGELVWVREANNHCLGIATGDVGPGSRGVVILSAPPEFRPTYSGNEGDFVLSYGKDWGIHLSSNARMITPFGISKLVPGGLIIGPSHTLMQLASNRLSNDPFLDISIGALFDQSMQLTECWLCLDWEIRLDRQGPDSAPVFAFAAP